MESSVMVRGLQKSYKNKSVINGMDYEAGHGIHLIKGKNGSGKSTFLKLLCGIEGADYGTIEISGYCINKQPEMSKKQFGYMPADVDMFLHINPQKLFEIVCLAKQVPFDDKCSELVTALSLDEFTKSKFEDLSFGTKRKVFLVCALIGEPSVLLLDEPTNGLDEDSFAVLTKYISERQDSATILIVTHNDNLLSLNYKSITEL
ncbi:ATP-binding cassette domain-containing protein [Pseudoalteromonas prydzensis]|uniref:ABC transporter ATP-binding protein n=1 Tax=Pseudoalteromonas prydzensis TaxID=182141 RepID=A0ABR9FLW2_9GAMM|nr:ABC transporter ATP-binding protein [Pseudoalteromonas prydzensis]MBE0457794.1 ABC transporter ATP-binding protein [Pseudoalteromonas prydzensis]